MAQEKSSRMAPFLLGAGVGIVGAVVAGLMSGWLTTGSVRDVQVSTARLDGEARVCEARVTADRAARGDSSDLRGFSASASDTRMALAQSFSQPLKGMPAADPLSVRACAERLNTTG
jgi:hypothetical protein